VSEFSLREKLVTMVEETIQLAYISLWLYTSEHGRKRDSHRELLGKAYY